MYIYFMKLVLFIAPSKTFKSTEKVGSLDPLFIDKTNFLKQQIVNLDKVELAKRMKLSTKLSDEVFSFFRTTQKSRALNLYSGISYKAMDSDTLIVPSNQLYIVDAYYGLVRPDDAITPYRLDFTMSFLGNLYAYWKETIFNYIEVHHKDDLLIDLTSKEFSPLIPDSNHKYRIDFVGKSKDLNSVLLKKMRGKFTRYILDHKLNTIEEIKEIKIEGFSYDPQSSNHHLLVFSIDN